MSVTLNPEALLAIQRGEGMLGEAIRHDLERRAEAVVIRATEKIKEVIPFTEGTEIAGYIVSDSGEELVVRVGVTGFGKGQSDTWSEFFDKKAIRDRGTGRPGDWLFGSLEAARD